MPHRTILFLDDDSDRHAAIDPVLRGRGCIVQHVYTYREAVQALLRSRFDEVWLDYDLCFNPPIRSVTKDGRELTGLDVALVIPQLPAKKRPGEVVIHSRNEDGARDIEAALTGFVKLRREPFGGSYADVVQAGRKIDLILDRFAARR